MGRRRLPRRRGRVVTYLLVIPGRPTPLPRGRPVARGCQGRGRMVYPAAYTAWVSGALVVARAAARGIQRLTGPCEVIVCATWARPRNSPAFVPAEVWATGERIRRPCRPDADNVAKAVLDLLNGIAYDDDGQVCSLGVSTWYAARGETPMTLVTVRPLPWLREEAALPQSDGRGSDRW